MRPGMSGDEGTGILDMNLLIEFEWMDERVIEIGKGWEGKTYPLRKG